MERAKQTILFPKREREKRETTEKRDEEKGEGKEIE